MELKFEAPGLIGRKDRVCHLDGDGSGQNQGLPCERQRWK
jgi:hypothetical protein